MIWYMLMPVLKLWSWVKNRDDKYLLMNVEYTNLCIPNGDDAWDVLLDTMIEWAVSHNGHAGGDSERMLFDFKILPDSNAIATLTEVIKIWALMNFCNAYIDIREVTMSELDAIYGT